MATKTSSAPTSPSSTSTRRGGAKKNRNASINVSSDTKTFKKINAMITKFDEMVAKKKIEEAHIYSDDICEEFIYLNTPRQDRHNFPEAVAIAKRINSKVLKSKIERWYA